MNTATKRKRYLVNVVTWSSYVQWIEAESADDDIERAEEDYSDNADENFKHKDGGIDSCAIWEEEEIGGTP